MCLILCLVVIKMINDSLWVIFLVYITKNVSLWTDTRKHSFLCLCSWAAHAKQAGHKPMLICTPYRCFNVMLYLNCFWCGKVSEDERSVNKLRDKIHKWESRFTLIFRTSLEVSINLPLPRDSSFCTHMDLFILFFEFLFNSLRPSRTLSFFQVCYLFQL